MKIIFYDIKPYEYSLLKDNPLENTQNFFESERLIDSTDIKDEYKDADALSVFVSSVLDLSVLKNFPNLKFIFLRSAGYSNVDLEYCKNQNIYVFNAPNYGTTTVAEYVFSLILAVSKNLVLANKEMLQGSIDHSTLIGTELINKTLGIIGMGLIGKKTAQIAKCFDMNVLAYDIKHDGDFNYVELDELLTESDFISINCPLNEATRGLINKEKFEKMKNTAFLINTARGEIVNTQDLYYALQNKKLKGAALDVVECEEYLCQHYETCKSKEFLKDICLKKYLFIDKLSKMPNVIITPHIAYNTKEAVKRIVEITQFNINLSFKDINSFTKNLVLI